MLNLKVDDIYSKEKYILVRAKVSKTRTERILPISSQVINLLSQLCEISGEFNQEYIFLSSTGKNKIGTQDIFHNFRRYKKGANIKQKCTPYVLRHTFATEMVKKGMDIFTLQRIMGHKNITTTRQYVFIGENDIKNSHIGYDLND